MERAPLGYQVILGLKTLNPKPQKPQDLNPKPSQFSPRVQGVLGHQGLENAAGIRALNRTAAMAEVQGAVVEGAVGFPAGPKP